MGKFETEIYDEFNGPFAEEGNSYWSVLDMAWIIDGVKKDPKLNIRCHTYGPSNEIVFKKGGIALTPDQFNALVLKGIEMGYGVDTESLKTDNKKTINKKSYKDALMDEDEDEIEEKEPPKKLKKKVETKLKKKVLETFDEDEYKEFVEDKPKKKKKKEIVIDIDEDDDDEDFEEIIIAPKKKLKRRV